jgi:hypothetical protein
VDVTLAYVMRVVIPVGHNEILKQIFHTSTFVYNSTMYGICFKY